jgi:ASC-1-like (ASCH) protein
MAHNVVLDKEGMELVKEDGKMVEARVMKKGADLKVLSFKVIEKAAETPAEKPAEKPKM